MLKDGLHKITIIGDEGNSSCFVDGIKRETTIDFRGKKKKFWISEGDNKQAYLVKYEDRNTRSYENAGQFIMCGVLEQLNIPHAQYLVCDFEIDGNKYEAIMSKNYKKSEDIVEFSGFTLNNKYQTRTFDNSNGEKIDFQHNVSQYMEMLKTLYGKNPLDFDKIKLDLEKYCLIQYVFMMSDLHFYNLSFMYNENLGHKSLQVVPFYDCGNICTLNLSKEKIQNNLSQLAKTKKKGVLIDSFYYKKMPLFGLDSNICEIISDEAEASHPLCKPLFMSQSGDEQRMAISKEYLEIFREQLALELLSNPQLNNFYEELKTRVNFDEISSYYNNIKEDTIPSYALDLVKEIFSHNIRQLDKKYVKARINLLKNQADSYNQKGEEEIVND